MTISRNAGPPMTNTISTVKSGTRSRYSDELHEMDGYARTCAPAHTASAHPLQTCTHQRLRTKTFCESRWTQSMKLNVAVTMELSTHKGAAPQRQPGRQATRKPPVQTGEDGYGREGAHVP